MISATVKEMLDKELHKARKEFDETIGRIAQGLRNLGFNGEIQGGFQYIIDYGNNDRKNGQGMGIVHVLKMLLPVKHCRYLKVGNLEDVEIKYVEEFNQTLGVIAQNLRDQGFRGIIQGAFKADLNSTNKEEKQINHSIIVPLPLDPSKYHWVKIVMGDVKNPFF